ncbi:RNA-directed DNA polymerase-like protein [Gossypium australe]|uniref:RNA-directed DNA polymerase-like protein n=1 Tax=Gossypium australe TaxID=47621 RepID=A0A5B6VW65_9ROSI|nr:RNA-directed DNA polymerase-like protein [Gossypium australe]
MKEIVKKEIIKWLDAGIIYPIFDSSCVSPVKCIPKKGGVTVMGNDNNEIIQLVGEFAWAIINLTKQLRRIIFLSHSSIKCHLNYAMPLQHFSIA